MPALFPYNACLHCNFVLSSGFKELTSGAPAGLGRGALGLLHTDHDLPCQPGTNTCTWVCDDAINDSYTASAGLVPNPGQHMLWYCMIHGFVNFPALSGPTSLGNSQNHHYVVL